MNTYNWDIIYVNSNESINKQLKKYMNENKITFTYEEENSVISLTFDNWEIIPGGSSKFLRMKTLVKEGELTFLGQRTILNGICPYLEVQLGFSDDKNDSKIQNLMFNFQVNGNTEGGKREGEITVINPDVNNIFAEESLIYAILKKVLADMFIANKEQISYIFAHLNISPDISWMQPKKFEYSYYSPTSSDKGFLSILSVVTNRDISGLGEAIDGAILDNHHDSFLVISERLFLEHIIMPELPNSFGHGTTKEHLKFEATSNTSGFIKNNKNIDCASVRVGAIDYYPKFEKLNIKVEGKKLQMKASGKCDVTGLANTYVKFDVEANFSFYYDRINKEIQFKQDSPPKVNTEKVIPWWVWILGVVTIGIINGIASAIENSIAKNLKIEPNAIVSKLKADVVRWSGMDHEEISDCVLDVAFCIKGKSS